MDLTVTTVLNVLAILVVFFCSYLVLSLKCRIPGGMAGKSVLNQPRKLKA